MLPHNFPDDAVERYMRLAQRALSVPAAALFLRQNDTLQLRCGAGIPDQLELTRELAYFLPPEAEAIPRVVIDDVRTTTSNIDALALSRLGWQAVAVLQFGLDSGAVAVLVVADERPRRWEVRDSNFLTEIAGMIVLELRRDLRMREERGRQLAIEEARRDTEERYHRLFANSRDAIYMTLPDGKITDANPSMIEMFGYSRAELLRLNIAQLYATPQERLRWETEMETSGSLRQHEVKLRRKDGVVLDCLKTATITRKPDGTITGFQGIIHDISERKRFEQQLAYNAFHDPLTGISNRSLFMDRLELLVRGARRRPQVQFAVLFLDLDRFKSVNDTYGHMVGDQLLQSVARRLESCLRNEDTVARMGGDEFAILLDPIHDEEGAVLVADRIIESLSVPFNIGGNEIITGTSIGIALSRSSLDTAETLLRNADVAMYRSKTGGRGRYQFFNEDAA